MEQFDDFDDFFPYYLSQHSKPATRWMHFVGSALAIGILANGLVRGPRKSLLLAPVVGYGMAWISHFVIEHNTPASFDQPMYSFRGDWKMFAEMAMGHDAEMQAIADLARQRRGANDASAGDVGHLAAVTATG